MRSFKNYIPPNPENWTGRKTGSESKPLYYYQSVKLLPLKRIDTKSIEDNSITILGYECEEGIKRNNGRLGSQKGPKAIKEALAKLAVHYKEGALYDGGSTFCVNGNLEECQSSTSELVSAIINSKSTPLLIGGGHDIAYANFEGILNSIDHTSTIGIINFDAHFDLRLNNEGPNSGTPFYQCAKLCQEKNIRFNYLVLGIQKASNTSDLFETAEKLEVKYLLNDELFDIDLAQHLRTIEEFIENKDHIYVSIDMDCFSSAFAPGVSAASPIGISPELFFPLFQCIIKSDKIISLDIAETNPTYDLDGRTSKLVAQIIDFYIRETFQQV